VVNRPPQRPKEEPQRAKGPCPARAFALSLVVADFHMNVSWCGGKRAGVGKNLLFEYVI
jgi:hypothetical protein